MSRYDDSWERLDSEFDHFLLDMKPYVLKHPNKTERQRCAIWIKKLCDPATCGSGLTGRKNRNMYARLLLHMLKRGILELPFTSKPEAGSLKTLPTYMVTVTALLNRICNIAVLPCSSDIIYDIWLSMCFQTKIKVLEAKHQEEKLKMQQRHDADVEKILDRKNGEIEEMKTMYRAKQKESEELIHKLEKKAQSVLRESQVICESKEKQIAELKKMLDQSADSLKNEWEKKLHAAVTEMEQEKFELQKKHTENIQELLEDTNIRLAKMEAEYNARSQATEQTVRELELRVKQQSMEVEKGSALRQKVTQEKAQLEIHIASISAELQEVHITTTHPHDLMEDFEKTVAQLKQQLLDSEHRRHQQVRVLAIQSEAEKERTEAKRKIAKLEDALREMESQLDRARESQRQQIQQADMALEQFKKQVELSSEKAYADMKLQMEKVEEDLSRSKSLRESQAKEFSQQLDSLRQKYEQQMAEQRMQHEQERTRLQQQHSAEKDSLVQERQREVSSLERQARAALQQHQQHTQEWRKRDAQTISDLEAQLSSLCEELQSAHAQYKQQLAEMASLREEEKQRAFLDKEVSLDRLRSDMERIRSDLERSHQQEKDTAQEKTNSRLKQIEKEYSQKLAKSAQVISFLFSPFFPTISFILYSSFSTEPLERFDKCTDGRGEEALQEKVESLQRQLHCSEKKLLSKELETEEKVTVVRQECEEKIKGLMPAELRQELEDTITSLKAQVRTDCLPDTDQIQARLEQTC
uniref:Centrosomal protein 112 n=1 Tax=Dicentrarchus labrax TaxID=13489 RepID=A0A8C4F8J7_DICLA